MRKSSFIKYNHKFRPYGLQYPGIKIWNPILKAFVEILSSKYLNFSEMCHCCRLKHIMDILGKYYYVQKLILTVNIS